jgi:hypothetical protein
MAAHLPPGVAFETVGVDGQEATLEVMAGTAQLPQTDLQLLGLGDGVGSQQVVNGGVAGDEGQAVGHFEAFLRKLPWHFSGCSLACKGVEAVSDFSVVATLSL